MSLRIEPVLRDGFARVIVNGKVTLDITFEELEAIYAESDRDYVIELLKVSPFENSEGRLL
jgi:hypothetical protein